VANDGNVLVVPRGVIEITDMFGAQVGNFDVNENGGRVFPKRDRTYDTLWSEAGFKFGRYEAVLTIDYGADQRRNMSSTLAFWILPMNIIMPIILGLLAIVVLAYIAMSFHVKRKIRQIEKKTGGRGRVVHERAPMSGLMVAAIVLLVFAIVFLMALFVMFA
jgi:hypothetical protein